MGGGLGRVRHLSSFLSWAPIDLMEEKGVRSETKTCVPHRFVVNSLSLIHQRHIWGYNVNHIVKSIKNNNVRVLM